MRKWNAKMPRERAKEGDADLVLAFRSCGGTRAELECVVSQKDAQALMDLAIEMMKNYKESK